jgi:YXWGXW repeat-containing protein
MVGSATGYGLDRDLRIAGAEVHRMKALIGTTLVAAFVLISGSVVGAQVSIGIQIGPPPPPRVVYVAPPPPPQPEYVWVEGYWYPVERRYVWHDGYWTRPPYAGAHWVAARYDGRVYLEGYWNGPRGRFEHDHRWDADHDRDYHPGNGNGNGNGNGRGRGHR